MSRSRKRSYFRGITTARSEKHDKRLANRAHRRVNRTLLSESGDAAARPLRPLRALSSVWSFSKDGKVLFDPRIDPRSARK